MVKRIKTRTLFVMVRGDDDCKRVVIFIFCFLSISGGAGLLNLLRGQNLSVRFQPLTNSTAFLIEFLSFELCRLLHSIHSRKSLARFFYRPAVVKCLNSYAPRQPSGSSRNGENWQSNTALWRVLQKDMLERVYCSIAGNKLAS